MASRFIESGSDDTAVEYLEDTFSRKALVTLASAPPLACYLETLKTDERDHQTINTISRANLAISLHSLGRIAEAVPYYHENLRLRRDWPTGANNLATLAAAQAESGDFPAARAEFAKKQPWRDRPPTEAK